jgi:hypothetical protein
MALHMYTLCSVAVAQKVIEEIAVQETMSAFLRSYKLTHPRITDKRSWSVRFLSSLILNSCHPYYSTTNIPDHKKLISQAHNSGQLAFSHFFHFLP